MIDTSAENLPVIDEQFHAHMPWYGVEDQLEMQGATVALAGVGGAGGYVVQLLARRGVSNFHIADPDIFSASNINRQAGSNHANIGRNKAEVSADFVRAIHPESANVSVFSDGVTEGNLERFLEGVDVVVDAIDVNRAGLAVSLGRMAAEMSIPVFVGIEVGDGCSITCFRPAPGDYSESVDHYYGIEPGEPLSDDSIALVDQLVHIPSYATSRMVQAALKGEIDTPAGPEGAAMLGATMASLIKKWLISEDRESFDFYYPDILVHDPFETGVIVSNRAEYLESSFARIGTNPIGSGGCSIKGEDFV